ncbi:MAG: hypothetical protein H6813_00890 [Phycisphaeraceae bacterium]|nr:hypothetical protein [Phycisphaeraceae bacterium]MCB9847358.1 hypothetical protein [Phycisphaeraceae bacterium]
MPRGLFTPNRTLTLTTLALIVLALAPYRTTRWLGGLTTPVEFALAPVQHPASIVAHLLRPPRVRGEADDETLRALRLELDCWRSAFAEADGRIAELERLLRDLQSGAELASNLDIMQVAAPVIGGPSDLTEGLLRVRAGTDRGVVARSSVATTRGVHLVGRVIEVTRGMSTVLPVTNPRAGLIDAVVLTSDGLGPWACQLEPAGDGSLEGDLVAEAQGIVLGQVVTVRDRAWPASAQGLILGRVTEIETKPNQRLRIRVTPDQPSETIGEVILRCPRIPDDPGGAP